MFPAHPVVEAPLNPLIAARSIRPPPVDAPRPPPKPSSAPAPRLRPNAPFTAAVDVENIPHAPLSPADDLADTVSRGTLSQVAAVDAFDSASLADAARRAPLRRNLPPAHDPLFFRKAAIPVLLTFTVLPAAAAILIATSGEDNALPDLFPTWAPLALLAISAICLAMAALNMLAMKNAIK
jgi:hypothetical protein